MGSWRRGAGPRLIIPTYTELVRRYFAASEANDGAAVGELVTEGVTWWAPQSTSRNNIPRPLKGRDLMLRTFWKGARFSSDGKRWEIERLIESGDMVAAQASLHATRVTGAPYDNDYVFLFRFEGEQIAEIWEYLDTAYFFDQQ